MQEHEAEAADWSYGEYMSAVRNVRSKKRLGQNFLICPKVAKASAAHAAGKRVLEIGPGLGFLTNELCKTASSVIAVEKDSGMAEMLSTRVRSSNLRVIKADFLDEAEKLPKDIDILIANIPYNISSKVVEWATANDLESVICLQKEFVEHMTASPGTRNYTRLSVICSLTVSITEIMPVPATCFVPRPRVSSKLIYMKPNGFKIGAKDYNMIRLLMEHKKKRVKNALFDSRKELGLDNDAARAISSHLAHADSVVFKLTPKQILETAHQMSSLC